MVARAGDCSKVHRVGPESRSPHRAKQSHRGLPATCPPASAERDAVRDEVRNGTASSVRKFLQQREDILPTPGFVERAHHRVAGHDVWLDGLEGHSPKQLQRDVPALTFVARVQGRVERDGVRLDSAHACVVQEREGLRQAQASRARADGRVVGDDRRGEAAQSRKVQQRDSNVPTRGLAASAQRGVASDDAQLDMRQLGFLE
mmetsp:Transcript_92561/g.261462  ORF Transcript_92561/g.261462 Transcript_92561/m.261462 type:complete len:203 (+) Transcript_92561:141-749(+)